MHWKVKRIKKKKKILNKNCFSKQFQFASENMKCFEMACRKCVKISNTLWVFLITWNPFHLLPGHMLILYYINLSDKSTNFCEWLSAWKSQIHMLLRLEISIKYNLSITFAPKNIVSPRLTFSLVFFLFFTFIFIYLFCIVFELLPLLNELRFGKFIFKPFYGWFFYASQPHYTIASAVPRFSLT